MQTVTVSYDYLKQLERRIERLGKYILQRYHIIADRPKAPSSSHALDLLIGLGKKYEEAANPSKRQLAEDPHISRDIEDTPIALG